MLGPLPTLYRVLVSTCVVLASIGLGAWLTHTLPGPFLAPAGAGMGAGLGVIVVFALLHDSQQHAGRRHRVRIRSQRPR